MHRPQAARQTFAAAKPNAKQIVALVKKVKAAGVKAIFTESSLNPKLKQQIARDASIKVYANRYGDTLGPAASHGATYLQIERWNVTAIVNGLLGRSEPVEPLLTHHVQASYEGGSIPAALPYVSTFAWAADPAGFSRLAETVAMR